MIIKTKNIGQETGVYDKYGIPIKIGHIVTWHSGDPKISSEVGYVHTNGEEISRLLIKRIQEGSNSKYEQKTIICQSTDKNDVEEFDKTCTQMVKDGWRTIDLLVVEGKLARVFYLSEVERAIKKYN